jgi:hypothetical protein
MAMSDWNLSKQNKSDGYSESGMFINTNSIIINVNFIREFVKCDF